MNSGSAPAATEADVAARTRAAFVPRSPVRLGAEVEWLVHHADDRSRPVAAAEVAAIAGGPLPAGGRVTVEPGGQLELVTRPVGGPRELVDVIEADAAALVRRFSTRDLRLVAVGLDRCRPARRTLELPRYAAMERYFARHTPVGMQMMNRTASLQLNIDFGPDPAATWRRAHRFAPLLSAMFANTPTVDGRRLEPMSRRQQIWAGTDPARTRPVGGPPERWHRYVLEAPLMLRHGAGGEIESADDRTAFGEWLRSPDPPTVEDLELHLTTLFPPLRPRGYLEVRCIDAVPRDGRSAAIAVVWMLLTDPDFAPDVAAVLDSVDDPWRVATEEGLGHPTVRAAGLSLLAATGEAFRSSDQRITLGCRGWAERIEHRSANEAIDALAAAVESG